MLQRSDIEHREAVDIANELKKVFDEIRGRAVSV
jgi:hypothetical protein